MRKIVTIIMKTPLDLKVFMLTFLLIFGIFIIPKNSEGEIVYVTYILFIFVSGIISSFFYTYVGDSKYNFFRGIVSKKRFFITLGTYLMACIIISFILAKTEFFLFLLK